MTSKTFKASDKYSVHWEDFGRVTVFIDAANVIYSLRDLGWKIDYKKLQQYFQKKTKLVDIYFYTAYFVADTGRKNMVEMLSRKGFKIRAKEVKSIRKHDGGILHKANCDVELTMDAMSLYSSFDTAILMSGDSDFVPLLKFLQSKDKKVLVISTRGHIAKELAEACNKFLYFDLFKNVWQLKSESLHKADSR